MTLLIQIELCRNFKSFLLLFFGDRMEVLHLFSNGCKWGLIVADDFSCASS